MAQSLSSALTPKRDIHSDLPTWGIRPEMGTGSLKVQRGRVWKADAGGHLL